MGDGKEQESRDAQTMTGTKRSHLVFDGLTVNQAMVG